MDGTSRIKRIEDIDPRIVRQRIHSPQRFTIGGACTFYEKEGWHFLNVY